MLERFHGTLWLADNPSDFCDRKVGEYPQRNDLLLVIGQLGEDRDQVLSGESVGRRFGRIV